MAQLMILRSSKKVFQVGPIGERCCFGRKGGREGPVGVRNLIYKFGLLMSYDLILVHGRCKRYFRNPCWFMVLYVFGMDIIKCMFGNMTCRH